MHRLKTFVIICAVGVIAVNTSSRVVAQLPTSTDKQELKRIIEKYAAAVDQIELADEVWETSEEVTFIQPRGHQKGWEAIKKAFYEKTMGQTFSKRKLMVDESTLQIRVYGDAAWAEFYWTFDATMRKDNSSIQTEGRETQIFRKTADGWRIVHVHYSNMPVTGEREGF